jgi:hypothetical protein
MTFGALSTLIMAPHMYIPFPRTHEGVCCFIFIHLLPFCHPLLDIVCLSNNFVALLVQLFTSMNPSKVIETHYEPQGVIGMGFSKFVNDIHSSMCQ